MVENPRSGEQVEFLVRTPELLVMRSTWNRPGHRALEHVHPVMEESYEVVRGRAAFQLGGPDSEVVEAGPGERVVVPPGTRHVAWNPTDAPVELRIEMRPALRWAEFTERFFCGDDPVALLEEFADEVVLPAD